MKCKVVIFLILSFSSLICYAQFRNVKKGDVLQVNGVKGVVFNVNEDGSHGQMMSVKAFRAKKNLYCSKLSDLKGIIMHDENDGKANTNELFAYVSAKKVSLNNYPVYSWCKSLGDGWYIPAVNQVKAFVNYWLGNTELEEDWDEDEDSNMNGKTISHSKVVNNILLESGGIPFINGVFTSTLDDDRKVDIFEYNKEDGKWKFKKVNPMKIDAFCVGRAFYDF
jgi:hypothetical protein